jgi:hypothetical protein
MIYVTSRRWNDNVWVRSNDILLPNLAQVGHVWEDGQQDLKEFGRVGITRWTSPVDNENCKVIGWRHFHPEVNSRGIGNPDQCGVEMVDFVGQDGKRSYDERQRIPGDFDAQVSQRPIARHALEHLTYCDKGVVMLRRMLLREIKRLEASEPLNASPLRSQGKIPTYCHDTVVRVPGNPQRDDDALVRKVGADLTKIIVEGDYHATDDRIEHVRLRIRNYVEQLNVQAAE